MVMPVEALPTPEDERLRREILEAREKLSVLERDLGTIDGELSGLSAEREIYDLLEQTCGTLERLDALGAGDLFWGESSGVSTAEHVRKSRERASEFTQQVGRIEERRQALTDEIRQGQEVLDILEADLYEFELEAEERQQEWLVERDVEVPDRAALRPWASGEDDRRFRKSVSMALAAALFLGAVIPMIDLPLPDLELIPEVPDRFARLIEQLPPPPPPPPVVEEAPPPEEIVPEEPVVAQELPEELPETPVAPPVQTAEVAPEPAQPARPAGILAFRDNLANLDSRPSSALGAQARINSAGEAAVGRTERSMVTSQAPGSSGGINLASLSRDVGGGGIGDGIGGVELARVASSIGPGGNGDRPLAGSATAGRTDEEIQIVFDRYKSALYRLYNRELRNDPTLRGQVVLQLTIEPDGSVSFCAVQSSTLGSPVLEQQITDRVKTFDFGAKEGIAPVTILYPIDFLPAA